MMMSPPSAVTMLAFSARGAAAGISTPPTPNRSATAGFGAARCVVTVGARQ
jgi:hypothetical protein